jgi:sigma-B regulation protein RsbU (phosphoserine phosphatase)
MLKERPAEVEDLAQRNEALARRVAELESLDALRRDLRRHDDVEGIASCAATHVAAALGARRCAVLVDDVATGGWSAVAASDADGPLDPVPELTVERSDELLGRLENVRAVVLGADDTDESVAAALRPVADAFEGAAVVALPMIDGASSPPVIGMLVAVDVDRDRHRLLEAVCSELAFSLGAAIRNRARAEELAMLAVQERELVELLRDVEQRDAMIRADLEQAREFQLLMLGPLPHVRGIRIETLFEPLGVVGGDLYAFSDLGDRLRVFIADATGHGVRASLTTMLIKNGYESATHDAADPAILLERLNDMIARYKTAEMLFTAACLDLEPQTGVVRLASAAHPPPCIVRRDRIDSLEGGVSALMGLHPGMRFALTTDRLDEGESIYLFTDGIVEARDEAGELFGESGLYAAVRGALDARAGVAEAVRAAIKQFAGSRGLTDDATLVGLTRGESDEPPTSFRSSR